MSNGTPEIYPIIPIPTNLIPVGGEYKLNSSSRIWITPDMQALGEYLNNLLGGKLEIVHLPNGHDPAGGILLATHKSDPGLGNEGYQLDVSQESVSIQANHPAGVFYGIQTLRQLIQPDRRAIRAVQIVDSPRFSWRGIMLDVGRHFFPVDFIKRLIDVMALHKLNILHWHLTEDQGWRIEIKKYPRLTEVGSQRSASPIPAQRNQLDGVPYGGYYSQTEVKDIVAYAASRFITVVPEIEMPGHSMAALAAYPELGCTGGPYQVRSYWGIEKDVYCAGNEKVFTFLADVLDEVIELFPSRYIHIGGDECPKDRWAQCPKCQQVVQQHNLHDGHELQSLFIRRMEKYLNSRDRRLIGWDEILEGGLAPNATVMSWRGIAAGIQAVKQGHDVVMSPTDYCYLDYYQSENRTTEPPAIGGYLPLEKVYTYNPVPAELSREETRHILGTQGNLWTEYIPSEEQAEYMLFPRTCALAEVAWSLPQNRNYSDFHQRLALFLPLLDNMGIVYRPIKGDI